MVWSNALVRPSGAQMKHLKSLYESLEWWKLVPRLNSIDSNITLGDSQDVLVKSDTDNLFVIYFPNTTVSFNASLTGLTNGEKYAAKWFNPRTGVEQNLPNDLYVNNQKILLPVRPSQDDWFIILNKKHKPVEFHVRDFGALPSSKNVRLALEATVKAASKVNGPAEILFEPNMVYRISLPDKLADQSKHAWLIKNATNLTINGQGATLLVTNPEIGAISTEKSSHITVKNFMIDYDPLPYAQGIITAVNPSKYWFDLKVDEGFMEPDKPCFKRAMAKWGLTIRGRPNGRKIYGPTPVFSERWEKNGNRVWRFYPLKTETGYTDILLSANLKPGERYVHMARNWSQAVAAKNCDHILWESITILSSPGLAFFPHITSYHTIRDCHVKVKEGRIFSTNADGIHMRGSRGHVLIERCSFEGMADDGINLHSSALSIQKQPAPNQVLVKKHTFSVRPGDELVLVRSASAKILNKTNVKEVQDKGANWLITLDQSLPKLDTGSGFDSSDNLYNLSEMASPFVIRNCQFNDYRGRGILVSTHNGLIENNAFNLNEGWGVVLSYESVRWAEGPIAKNITIRNNKFRAYKERPQPAVFAHIITRDGATVNSRPFSDIKIESNRFYEYGGPVIMLNDACDVSINNNQIFCSKKAAARRSSEYAAVVLKNCENVKIDKLKVENTCKKQYAVVDIDSKCASGKSISVNSMKTNVAKTCKPIMDQRIKK
ncbi:MAG: hypothetical protein DRJ61_18590 [Acidobacteria bacterium]|nr:MAG: hypothetical protein DRJ61_18590 [Acidobacteriota bacterium]